MVSMTGRLQAVAMAIALLVGSVAAASVAAQDATPASGTGEQSQFFVQADYDEQLAQREIAPEGPADQPWIQAIAPEYVDTAQYTKPAPWKVCFSNAGVNNPWRVVGWTTMQEEVKLHPEITDFVAIDAEGRDEKQITDIADLLTQGCSVLIVSPTRPPR